MRTKKLNIFTLLLLVIGLTRVQAQETIPATGSEASGVGGVVSYTVGQVVYTSNTGTNGNSTALGVQQPYEISVVSGIDQTNEINLLVTAYPNPTSNFLTLHVDKFDNSNLSYQLYNMQGEILQNVKITDNETHIVMNNLVTATYFVKVIQVQDGMYKKIKTFKIVKIQ